MASAPGGIFEKGMCAFCDDLGYHAVVGELRLESQQSIAEAQAAACRWTEPPSP